MVGNKCVNGVPFSVTQKHRVSVAYQDTVRVVTSGSRGDQLPVIPTTIKNENKHVSSLEKCAGWVELNTDEITWNA